MEGAELPYSSNIYQGRESDNVRIISFRTHTNEILQIVQCISLLPPVFPDSPDLEVPLVPADADDREAGGVHHHHHHLVIGPVRHPTAGAAHTVLCAPDDEGVSGWGAGLDVLPAPYHQPVGLAGRGGGVVLLTDDVRVPGLLRGKDET